MSERKTISPQEAARHLLMLKDAEESFLGYVRLMRPDWKVIPPFQLEMIDVLDRLEKGTLTNDAGQPIYRVMFNLPPRHSKSSIASELFPAYFIARKLSRKVLSSSYGDDLARSFGGTVKGYVEHPLTKQAFPNIELDPGFRAKDHWRTAEGGQYVGVGLEGSTTGKPANLLNIDDPVKNRTEADSLTYRNRVWSIYTSSLETRKEPDVDGNPPIEIVTLTRWHPDDLGGRIQQTDDWKEGLWKHVVYKAINHVETDIKTARCYLEPDDPRYVPPGTLQKLAPGKRYVRVTKEVALWPERFPLEELKRKERRDPREFAALYQQTPYIQGGNVIKSNWWRFYKANEEPSQFVSIVIAADTAFKKSETADYSVLISMGLAYDGDIYILDLIRGRWDFPELKRQAINFNTRYRGKGLKALYIEDKASGQSLIQELRTHSGISVIPYKVVHDKVARVNAVTPLIEGGRVWLPEAAPWLDAFFDECLAFPNGTNDDQVDAMAIGLDALARTPVHNVDALTQPLELAASLNQAARRQLSPDGSLNSLSSKLGRIFRWGE